ncbi:hypothetical protein NL108_000586, partial [Boleophthalmus pectinirostris]
VCLGADAEDKFHMVEVEGLTFDGKTTTVPLAALKPSVLPSVCQKSYCHKQFMTVFLTLTIAFFFTQVSLGGFEITPPVTFRLQSGSGPVYISGQHFVGVKESDDEDEEENNTSPVKRPAGLSGKKPPLKKLKMDSDEDDSDEEDEDDEYVEQSVFCLRTERFLFESRTHPKYTEFVVKRVNETKHNSSAPYLPDVCLQSPASGKDKAQAGSSKSPSVAEIKNKLSTAIKE